MSTNIIEGTEEVVKQEARSTVPVVLDFWAEWCGPCKRIAPILEDVAAELKGKVKVIKVNVDNNQELADAYQVGSIPTIVFLKSGQEIERIVGAVPKESLMAKIKMQFGL